MGTRRVGTPQRPDYRTLRSCPGIVWVGQWRAGKPVRAPTVPFATTGQAPKGLSPEVVTSLGQIGGSTTVQSATLVEPVPTVDVPTGHGVCDVAPTVST